MSDSKQIENPAHELYHYYMWSQDSIASLIDASRPKTKKIIDGDVKPNDLQLILLKEVLLKQMTYKKYVENASRYYRLKLIKESSVDTNE